MLNSEVELTIGTATDRDPSYIAIMCFWCILFAFHSFSFSIKDNDVKFFASTESSSKAWRAIKYL